MAHALVFNRPHPGAVERVDGRIGACGNDLSCRNRASRRVSLVLESCQGPMLPLGRAGDAKDFFERSLAGPNLHEAILVECVKACFTRDLLDRTLILTSSSNRFADGVVDDQQFRYRRAAAIAGVAARITANRLPAVLRIYSRFACFRHLQLAL